jgi:hypothetical protein
MEDKVSKGRTEGRFTGAIESQTSKVPSAGYLAAAFRSHRNVSNLEDRRARMIGRCL